MLLSPSNSRQPVVPQIKRARQWYLVFRLLPARDSEHYVSMEQPILTDHPLLTNRAPIEHEMP
jgi:hypothetical protein